MDYHSRRYLSEDARRQGRRTSKRRELATAHPGYRFNETEGPIALPGFPFEGGAMKNQQVTRSTADRRTADRRKKSGAAFGGPERRVAQRRTAARRRGEAVADS